MALEDDQRVVPAAAATVSQMLRDYFAPDALDAAYQDAARRPQFKRAAQVAGEFSAKPGLLRRTTEPQAQTGGCWPEPCASNLRAQTASLP